MSIMSNLIKKMLELNLTQSEKKIRERLHILLSSAAI